MYYYLDVGWAVASMATACFGQSPSYCLEVQYAGNVASMNETSLQPMVGNCLCVAWQQSHRPV